MTIKEISKLAGVSQSTVSLALNNKAGVSEETKKLIMDIAAKSGYVRRSSAVKKNILFIKYIGDGAAIEQNGDFVARIIDAIELKASSLGYSLIMKNIQEADLENEMREINFEDYAGVIWLATEMSDERARFLTYIPIPVVAVDNMLEYYDIDSTVMDNYGGIFDIINHLYGLGHRKIGYIGSTVKFSNFIQRAEGYLKALRYLGLLKTEYHMMVVQPTLEGAYNDTLKQLEDIQDFPTAFVAANDTIAIGAIKALRQKGIKIPDHISVTGFDDIPFSTMLDKSLTTMRVNKEKLGEAAVYLLDAKINSSSDQCVKLVVRPKLIQRESTKSYEEYLLG